MTTLRITNGFARLSDGDLQVRAQTIASSMENNASFPNPVPSLATLNTALNEYSAAIVAAEDGGRLNVAIKRQKKEELINLLHQLGSYVVMTANGDSVIALSSGFKITKTPEPGPSLVKPENLVLADGINAGEINISFKRVPGARMYLVEHTTSPERDESWQSTNTSVSKAFFKNLESGKRYWWRVAALGINNQLVYSDTLSRIVQ